MFREEDFPQEATEKNIKNLIEIGCRINEAKPEQFRREPRRRFIIRSQIAEILLILFFEVIAIFAWTFTVTLSLNLGIQSIVPVELRVSWGIFVLFVVGLIIAGLFLKFYILTRHKIIPQLISGILRRFGTILPPLEHDIFSHSCAIAENILNGKRSEAEYISYFFIKDLTRYIKTSKELNGIFPEIRIIDDLTAAARMMLFSDDQEIPFLLINLSLAFIHQNYPKVHSLVTDLGYSLSQWKIEKPKARIRRLIELTEEYPRLVYLIIVAIFIILWLLGVAPKIPTPPS